jgi:predicted O-methyltransferase YrrM
VPVNEGVGSESAPPDASDFTVVFAAIEHIGGWLTGPQARSLWREARRVPAGGRIVEIGSHQGRSTTVLALAAPTAEVVAIDPFIDGPLFGGIATKDSFLANLELAGIGRRVVLREARSTDLRPGWSGRIDLLYIDGKHDYWTCSDDLRWAEHVPSGGVVLVHDAFSSIGVTLALLRHVLCGDQLRYLDRRTSLARFEVARPRVADRVRLLAQLPWWIRNVAIKLVLRLARLLGSTTPDPY